MKSLLKPPRKKKGENIFVVVEATHYSRMAEDFLHEDEEDWANPVENVACTAVTPKKAIHSKGTVNCD